MESILKLKVDNQEYNAKIDRARQGLLAMEQACRKVGGTFEVVEKEDLDFVKALGQMSTASNTAKGKVSELTKAFTDLQSQYNRLTSEEKSSPFGKALAQSLDQLKGRIQDGNKELQDIQNQLRGTTKESDNSSTGLQALADKFGLNIGQMAKFATAGAAVAGALKVAKDAFFANEESLDEWGRVVNSTQSVYEGFLNALNTGDISGYLSRMDQIVKAARDAYDAMDELGTFKAFNQRNELTGRNNLQNAINNFREGKGSKEDVQKAGDAYIKELKKRQTLEGSNYGKQIAKVAAEKGVDANELTRILTGDYASYKKAKSVQMTGEKVTTKFLGPGQFSTETTKYAKNAAEKMGEALREFNDTALKDIQQIGAEEIQTSIEIEQVRRQVDRATGVTTPKKPTTPKTPKPTTTETYTPAVGSIDEMQAKVKELNKQFNATADQSVRDNLKAQIDECNKQLDIMRGKVEEVKPVEMQQGISLDTKAGLSAFKADQQKTINTSAIGSDEYNMAVKLNVDATAMENILPMIEQYAPQIAEAFKDTWLTEMASGLDIPDEAWQEMEATINEKLAALNLDPIKLDVKTGNISGLKAEAKASGEEFTKAAQAVSAMGGALQSIEDPGAKVAGMVAQAIASIALTFAASMKGTFTPWDWIAGAAAGTATMIATIASIKSATAGSYADGGLIKGSSYTGDAVPIMANAGEIVLNYAQQSNIASALESKSEGGGGGRSTISGEQIVTVVNAYGRRTGRGEILR